MNAPATKHTGPLGSIIHVLRADAGTIAELAAIDWNRHFRRVCLDPVRGIITLMAPSFPHEDLTETPRPHRGRRRGRHHRRYEGAPQHPASRAGRAARHGDGSRTVRSTSANAPEVFTRPAQKGRRRPSPSSNGLRPIWWWRSRSRRPMKARPNATARWGCGSCGGCTAARARGSCTRNSSRCIPAARRAGSMPRKCWKGSRRMTCARRWKRWGPAGLPTNGRRRWPGSCAGGGRGACGVREEAASYPVHRGEREPHPILPGRPGPQAGVRPSPGR